MGAELSPRQRELLLVMAQHGGKANNAWPTDPGYGFSDRTYRALTSEGLARAYTTGGSAFRAHTAYRLTDEGWAMAEGMGAPDA